MLYDETSAAPAQREPTQRLRTGESAAHVCFEVTDMDVTWQTLIAAGASPQGEIALVDTGPVRGLKAGYLRDPGGIIIELVEIPLSQQQEA